VYSSPAVPLHRSRGKKTLWNNEERGAHIYDSSSWISSGFEFFVAPKALIVPRSERHASKINNVKTVSLTRNLSDSSNSNSASGCFFRSQSLRPWNVDHALVMKPRRGYSGVPGSGGLPQFYGDHITSAESAMGRDTACWPNTFFAATEEEVVGGSRRGPTHGAARHAGCNHAISFREIRFMHRDGDYSTKLGSYWCSNGQEPLRRIGMVVKKEMEKNDVHRVSADAS